MREFQDLPATRQRIPVLCSLYGPAGSGKSFSALRIATGIQRVTGGDIYAIDTESRRMLHYADRFRFRHVEFRPPHGPADYLAALQHCIAKKATIVIIDSASHMHEGEGGTLEAHAAETKRLAQAWGVKEDVAKISAWNKPKQELRRFINALLQTDVNTIMCFRAKQKLLIKKGEQPQSKGYMPIAAEELAFEMTINALLYPGASGVPTWHSDEIGEREMIKLPGQFHSLAKETAGRQLDEDFGEALAKWAAGGEVTRAAEVRSAIRAAETPADLEVIAKQIAEAKEKRTISPAEYKEVRDLWASRRDELSPPEPGAHG